MTEERDTGIPTRAIHEAYLAMQEAHRNYRQDRDAPTVDETGAHAAFQDAVLTFYELLRPHLRRKNAMSKFWEGELPEYPDQTWNSVDQAKEYCYQYGVAVWNIQKHVQTTARSPNANGQAEAMTDGMGTLKDWHERLGLSDNQRLVAIDIDEDSGLATWVELRAVAGLKQLDSWDTRLRKQRENGGGFLAGETRTSVELEYVAVWKLQAAKRLLAEAADKMSLLSNVDIDHDDGAILNFDQSRDDAQPMYKETEYNSSPDI